MSTGLHAPRERLSKETLTMHQAIVPLIEWLRRNSDDFVRN
ncbi:hypothetical protein [Iodidimonas muriae]|nr:hypothetical protein [Iodidimonas muriae]